MLEKMIIVNSFGYFSYDFVAMAALGLLEWGMSIHHLLCLSMGYIAIIEDVSLNYLVTVLFISEISNPCMHIRIIIKHLGMRYTKLYECLEISYILLYIYGRIFLGSSINIKII